MTKRTHRLFSPTILLPLASIVVITACGQGSNPSGTGGVGPAGSGGTASGGAGPLGSGGAGVGGAGGTGVGGNGGGIGGSPTTGGATSSGGSGGGAGAGGSGTGGAGGAEPTVLTVQLDNVKQIIRGFGLNATITDGSNLPWNQLFTLDGANALGLSILRIGMAETGGHRGVPSGWETVKDLGARVIGSCWTAPELWKDNDSPYRGHLESYYYTDWATLIAEYASDNGLYAMSIANEADFAACDPAQGVPCNPPLTDTYESMVYTGQEMKDFVAIAGDVFDDIAPQVQMIAPEASLWQHVWSNISPTGVGIPDAGYESSDPLNCNCFANTIDPAVAGTCAAHCVNGAGGELASGGYDYGHWLASDPAAWSAFDIMGVHQYETQVGYAWPADVNGGVKDREIWQTEMSGVSHWPEQGPSTGIENGVAVARWIHSALTVGEASAWLYWWYKSYYNDNNEGLGLMLNNNINDAPVTKRYYTMGNFSRYIRPDTFHAVRVAGPSPANIMVSAYKGDGGEVVIVAINETNAAADVPIAIAGTAPAMMVPIVTSASGNWVEGTPVAVTGGSLPAALPAMSVTTFVSQ